MLEAGHTDALAYATPAVSGIASAQGRLNAVALKPEVTGSPKHSFSFRDLLSDLNPLQFIPVVGTLFRAITGDVIPEPVRDAGSLVVSTLVGGPIGAALNLGALAAEKLTGFDPEKIGDRLLADIGIGGGAKHAAPLADRVADVTHPASKAVVSVAWSHAQLAAYGVTANAGGDLEKGDLTGSDVLNGLEFDQIRARQAVAQYNTAKPT